jgi:hypothetical protein
MREMGLQAPDYAKSDIDHVTVTLGRFGLMDPEVRSGLDSLPGARRPILRTLVEEGWITATALPTSRWRRPPRIPHVCATLPPVPREPGKPG